MRLFQIFNQGIGLPTLLFEDGAPNGGCIVTCGFCGETINTRDDTGRDRQVAPCCGNHLVFPVAEW